MKMNLTLEMIRTSRTTKLISLRRAAHLMNVGERERGAVEEKVAERVSVRRQCCSALSVGPEAMHT